VEAAADDEGLVVGGDDADREARCGRLVDVRETDRLVVAAVDAAVDAAVELGTEIELSGASALGDPVTVGLVTCALVGREVPHAAVATVHTASTIPTAPRRTAATGTDL
jgi:hypothetical protein